MAFRGAENPVLQRTIIALERAGRKNPGAGAYYRAAELLRRPTRKRAEVHCSKASAYAGEGKTIILVPGKLLLGRGKIIGKPTIACFTASAGARKAVTAAGGKVETLLSLVASNPNAKGVKVII